MVKNYHLAKSINDAGWYMIVQYTTYRAESAGKIVPPLNLNIHHRHARYVER